MQPSLNFYNKCPNCKSSKKKITKEGYKNRYSEQLSNFFNEDEKEFNLKFKNYKCQNCNLIYKSQWFKKKELNLIFNNLIPIHPKGWDKLSKKFTKKNFIALIKKMNILIKNKNNNNFNKTKREILSFIDSIKDNKKVKKLRNSLIKNLNNQDSSKILKISRVLSKKIVEPSEFSRFRGFESKNLIKHIESKIGTIETYSEIGCPLWGNLEFLSKKKIECSYIRGNKYEFWGKNCMKNNINCKKKLNSKIKRIGDIKRCAFSTKKDFIGIFLYLDHVVSPINFFRSIFANFRACGVILENSRSGVPIQHFSGWSKKTFQFVSKKFNKKLDNSFKEIEKSDKSLFLLY
tara:strand:+ start:2229 stop:3269 length:1041 start_codon:yes stop_codon:yes gene_type:complete